MRDLLLLTILLSLMVVIVRRPWIGVLAWFWFGLMAPHRLTWSFMTTAPVALAVGAVTLFALLLTQDRRSLPLTREIVLLVVLALYFTMTTLFAWVPNAAWGQWDTVMKIMLMTLVTPLLIYGERRIVLLILVATFSIAFYGAKGGIFTLTSGGQNMVLGPPKTFIAGNTVLGLALIMSLPLILISARMVRERWVELGLLTRWNRQVAWAMYGTFWLTCVAIMFTYSRGALLGLLAVGPFLFLKMRRKPVLVLLAVLAVGVVGVTVPDKLMDRWSTIQEYEEDGSAMGRIQSWGVSWNIAVENPILGAGFSSAGMPGDRWLSYANFLIPGKEGGRAAHSLYFQLLGHHGFGGFGVYMSLVICTVLTLNRIRRTAMATTGQVWLAEYAWAIQVSIFGFMVAGAFLDVAYFNLFFAYVALAVIMRRELAEARQAESSDTSVTDRGAGSRYVSSNGRRTFLPAGTPPSGSA